MNAIIYRPDGERLTFQETLQYLANSSMVSNPPDKLFAYGDFNDASTGLIKAIESIDFDLSGLEDALGLLVANTISSQKSSTDLTKLLTAYKKKHTTPSCIIQEQLTIRIAQWAQKNMTDIAEFKDFYSF
jgi:hypothetical protein